MQFINKWKNHLRAGLLLSMLVLAIGAAVVYADGYGSENVRRVYSNIKVQHVWVDDNDAKGLRPDSVTTRIYTIKENDSGSYSKIPLAYVTNRPEYGVYGEDFDYSTDYYCLKVHYVKATDSGLVEIADENTFIGSHYYRVGIGDDSYEWGETVSSYEEDLSIPEGEPAPAVIEGYKPVDYEKAEAILSQYGKTGNLTYDVKWNSTAEVVVEGRPAKAKTCEVSVKEYGEEGELITSTKTAYLDDVYVLYEPLSEDPIDITVTFYYFAEKADRRFRDFGDGVKIGQTTYYDSVGSQAKWYERQITKTVNISGAFHDGDPISSEIIFDLNHTIS